MVGCLQGGGLKPFKRGGERREEGSNSSSSNSLCISESFHFVTLANYLCNSAHITKNHQSVRQTYFLGNICRRTYYVKIFPS